MKSIDYFLESYFNITEISEKVEKEHINILDIHYYSNNSKTLF